MFERRLQTTDRWLNATGFSLLLSEKPEHLLQHPRVVPQRPGAESQGSQKH
jgi:hypothetical protein